MTPDVQCADYAPLDDLLARLAPFGGELKNGLTNHAPMVVEALCALGRGDAAATWLDAYADELLPWPATKQPIDPEHPDRALGDLERLSDWRALFAAEIARASWRDVVRYWVPRLAPGVSGAATHGVIRAAHAVRAVAEHDSAARRAECAAALAYWAATYRRLPLGGVERRLDARSALLEVPFVPADLRRHGGSIDDALAVLAGWRDFAPVGALLDVDRAPRAVGGELARTFARVLVANASTWLGAIVFVHAITSTVAVTSLAPWVAQETGRDLLRYGWQAAAALYAVYGSRPPGADLDAGITPTPTSVLDRALATRDEHAIKCAEACLRVWRETGDPALLRASRHATQLLSAGP